MNLRREVRKVAVASCALAADDDADDMDVLISLLLEDTRKAGYSDCVVLQMLAHSLVALALHVAGSEGRDRFDQIAQRMAVSG